MCEGSSINKFFSSPLKLTKTRIQGNRKKVPIISETRHKAKHNMQTMKHDLLNALKSRPHAGAPPENPKQYTDFSKRKCYIAL